MSIDYHHFLELAKYHYLLSTFAPVFAFPVANFFFLDLECQSFFVF